MHASFRFGLLLLISLVSAAQADDAGRLKLAHEVVAVAHAADNMRKLMPQLMAQMKPMMQQQGATDPKILDELIQRFLQRSDQTVDLFADLAASVYAREFSEEDLKALLNFYKSPAGQHLIAKQTVIAQGMFSVGLKWGEVMAKQVVDEYQKQKAQMPPKT